ncbi:MAG: filamentous hemagglutinin N-terminal domain-containing protein [Phenylobacterium sp.]|uniref:two-partner secretion domain-containing protein n=1 Tax=Phenylobacterium sp. TaxID=1871053 RepID=UPI001A38A5D8|nr:filamentous hemagglutinin N-terminal domain-containing protein [Phenylobacterium sp.]MBL8773401.1 filamentous hemagglutinin N-terminal domain-containing protein [Phenylobacterium sp.]
MRGAVAALGLVLAGWPLTALGQTAINPDVAAGRGLGTTVGQAGSVFTIDGGTRAGGNLFHSFSRFDLGAGDTALWTRAAGDAGAIANVINRVTGGDASTISGTLDSTALPNAAFWFINPAGVVFGAGARVNVPAAAYFSTAAALRFADGMRFSAAAPDGSTLSIAAPEAFGFVGGEGAITINGAGLTFAPVQSTLSFTASSIRVEDSEFAVRGLDLVAAGGAANVRLGEPLSGSTSGNVEIFNSLLGVVDIAAVGGRSLRVGGGAIDLQTSSLFSDGNVIVQASRRIDATGASINVSGLSGDAAGVIVLRAPEVILDDTRLRADAAAESAPGRILVEGERVALLGATVLADAKDGVGALPGLVQIRATDDLLLFGSNIRSNANGDADGGVVTLEGRAVEIIDSNVESDTLPIARGSAGLVTVKAETLLLAGASTITSTTNGEGAGGNVLIDTGELRMQDASAIRSDTRDSGDAGSVTIRADSIDLMDRASITSRARSGTGDAGTVLLDVGRLTMTDALISSGTDSRGDAGAVFITAQDIVMDGARRAFTAITSETFGPGAAGNVFIDVKTMTVRDGALVSSDTRSEGDAGGVAVVAQDLTVANGGAISSDSLGEGDAGDVVISARRLTVTGGDFDVTYISSDSLSTGDAGTVSIEAGSILVDGRAFISSDAYSGGEGGQIVVAADSIELRDFGAIRSQTRSDGDAGLVLIETKSLTLADGGFISSEAIGRARGDAGILDIAAERVLVGAESSISTSTAGSGDAGAVSIIADEITLDGGTVSSSAEPGATGSASLLSLEAQTLRILNGGAVSTLSTNPNPAGIVTIAAGEFLVDGRGSIVSSENQSGNPNFGGLGPGPGGDAGAIFIAADNVTISNGGRVSTNAFSGAAGDIQVSIQRPGLFTLEGAQAPGVIQTSSGPGTGGKITIADPLAFISNGGSVLAQGQQRGANVVIQSRYFINSTDRANIVDVAGDFTLNTATYDVSTGIVSRDISVLDASKVLRGQCPAARSTGAVSQLITRPVGPYAREGAAEAPQPRAVATPGGACP